MQNLILRPGARSLRLALLAAGFSLCAIVHAQVGTPCNARNIILVIGDGMGLAHVSLASYTAGKPLILEDFPVVGLQKTHSATDLVTDSGAAATAMACGVKTYNNAVGVTIDSLPCTSLFALAKEQGMRTGIVVTSSLVHATPAAFVAHQQLRGFYEGIALDYLTSQPDYFAGGGMMYFTNRFGDDRNLLEEFRDIGYEVSTYSDRSIRWFSGRSSPRMAYFTAWAEPLPRMQGRDYLPQLTGHALRVLTEHAGENGFILMVEGSQIDYAGHANNLPYLVSEMQDMMETLEVIMNFANDRDDTLVVVTGDHDVGGLRLLSGNPDRKPRVEFTTTSHTALMVPVYASGPCAELFNGVYDNTMIFHRICEAGGL